MQAVVRTLSNFFLDLTETAVIALSLWLVVYLFLFHPVVIQGSSMEPNFHNNDCVIASTVSYELGSPERGDVVPIHAPPAANCVPGTGCDFFKRIIGLPGETVEVKDCHYWIDGKALPEDYIPETFCTLPGPWRNPVTLGTDQYFVSGDNRAHSSDSRYFGPITRADIIGKAVLRTCPTSSIGIIP